MNKSPGVNILERIDRWLVRVALTAFLLGLIWMLILPAQQKINQGRNGPPIALRLRQVGIAMTNYAGTHGRLPPAAVYDQNGRPLLSWRVLLLPYLEYDSLFQHFKLDEPWDSPHNAQLLGMMPKVFESPGGLKDVRIDPFHTCFKVFVGKGAAFEGKQGLKLPEDFPDGTPNTILVIEAGAPVPWTKPEDIPFAPDQPLPKLVALREDGFYLVLADGHLRFIGKNTSEATLRAAITRNGHDRLGPDWNQ
jgi:hypothetical protein